MTNIKPLPNKSKLTTTNKKPNYEKAYNILMDYFDYLPDEDKERISFKLQRLGL